GQRVGDDSRLSGGGGVYARPGTNERPGHRRHKQRGLPRPVAYPAERSRFRRPAGPDRGRAAGSQARGGLRNLPAEPEAMASSVQRTEDERRRHEAIPGVVRKVIDHRGFGGCRLDLWSSSRHEFEKSLNNQVEFFGADSAQAFSQAFGGKRSDL